MYVFWFTMNKVMIHVYTACGYKYNHDKASN